ncbi:MAG: HEAT repeat domain-containing protein, partial [Planctomycetota bacterium]
MLCLRHIAVLVLLLVLPSTVALAQGGPGARKDYAACAGLESKLRNGPTDADRKAAADELYFIEKGDWNLRNVLADKAAPISARKIAFDTMKRMADDGYAGVDTWHMMMLMSTAEEPTEIRLYVIEHFDGGLQFHSSTSISGLIKTAKNDPDASIRKAMLDLLDRRGEAGHMDLEERMPLLDDREPVLRALAARAFTYSQDENSPLATKLTTMLQRDPDGRVRAGAVVGLAHIVRDDTKRPELLRKAMKDSDARVRLAVMKQIGKLFDANIGSQAGLYADDAIAALGDSDAQVRAEAGKLIARLPNVPTDKLARAMGAGLGSDDPEARATSARAIGACGKDGEKFRARLIELLADADVRVRAGAAEGLAGLGGDLSAQVARATQLLAESDPAVKVGAAMLLGAAGESASGSADALFSAASHSDEAVRGAAIEALARIGVQPQRTESLIRDALGRSGLEIQYRSAIRAAGWLPTGGSFVRDVIDVLHEHVKPSPALAADCVATLQRMFERRPELVVAVGSSFSGGEPYKWMVRWAVRSAGPSGVTPVVNHLRTATGHINTSGIGTTAPLLLFLGPPTSEAVEVLASRVPSALSREHYTSIYWILSVWGPAAKSALPQLLDAFHNHPTPEARPGALKAAAAVVEKPGHPDVMAAIAEALESDDKAMRRAALDILKRHLETRPSDEICQRVDRLLDSSDVEVRSDALIVLAYIGDGRTSVPHIKQVFPMKPNETLAAALFQLGSDKRGNQAAISGFFTSKTPKERLQMAWSAVILDSRNGKIFNREVKALLTDEYHDVRLAAASVLVWWGDKNDPRDAMKTVMDLLRDPAVTTRRMAADWLATSAVSRAVVADAFQEVHAAMERETDLETRHSLQLAVARAQADRADLKADPVKPGPGANPADADPADPAPADPAPADPAPAAGDYPKGSPEFDRFIEVLAEVVPRGHRASRTAGSV